MTLALREIEGRWTSRLVLKRDSFSTVERGRFSTPAGEVEAVLRRIDQVPWWTFPIAHHLFLRERRALAIAGRLGVAPPLLFAGRRVLVRGWIEGSPCRLQNLMATAPISIPRGSRFVSYIELEFVTTISPSSRTGCGAATAAPISPTSSSPAVSSGAADSFEFSPTRICGTSSSTSTA